MLQINQVKINAELIQRANEMSALFSALSKLLRLKEDNITNIKIIKKSLDARKKPELFWIYSLAFSIKEVKEDTIIKSNKKLDIKYYKEPVYEYLKLSNASNDRPVIIGSGPAGLFCAISLVKAGLKPIIIERGEKVEDRTNTINKFWNDNELNTESNVQFGEGGAGTFSDGKLNTGVKDKYNRINEVLKLFVKYGAKENILYSNKPHIGTDILRTVIKNIREDLIEKGASYYFNSRVDDIVIKDNKIDSVIINKGLENEITIKCSKLILAIGHSARDTFEMLYKKNIPMSNKPFAVGFRVMHSQKLINESQYGNGITDMPAADYKVTAKTSSGRGVYSFCMCPGGYIVNASSEKDRLCINGMSYNDRGSKTANSAIIITIDEKDYGSGTLDGMYFQRQLEENAYKLNKGAITVQKLIDFKNNQKTNSSGETPVSIKGNYIFGDITPILPEGMNNEIIEAFEQFGRSIKGFDNDDVLLTGIEARTSSPIKIFRDENFESSVKGLFPCGEGAGYAGGITSAAVDGLKVAESIISRYNLQALC